MKPLSVYIGYDSREPVAYHVLAHSILTRASLPVAITPLIQDQLRGEGLYTRPRGLLETTDFSLTRFLVPHLSGYRGISVFLDCDMLCQGDIWGLIAETSPDVAVSVCQHDYVPKSTRKFLDQSQSTYPRKNWSSVMVFNNAQCQRLTRDYVNTATGLMLHRFWWLDDVQIGALPLTWNWLVDEYVPNPDAQMLHYTNGGPWFEATADCDHADRWRAAREEMLQASQGVAV